MIGIYWDIDGTLLDTARAGSTAFARACEKIYGRTPDLARIPFHGACDRFIGDQIIRGVTGRPGGEEELRRLFAVYAEELAEALSNNRGRVLDNAREILEACHRLSGVRQYLQTGNTRDGAATKLRAHDLEKFFDFAGSLFGDNSYNRLEMIDGHRLLFDGSRDQICVFIGDTIHDIAAGRAAGALTIGVASGGKFSRFDLIGAGANIVWDRLPTAEEFVRQVRRF